MATEMRRVVRGDLCVVTPTVPGTGTPAVCLVLDPDVEVGGRRLVGVVLTSAEPELATRFDVVFAQGLCGVGWPVVAQTDLRAMVDPARVGEPVGRISDGLLAEANRLLTDPTDEVSTVAVRVGWALGGPCDRRWSHKTVEGRRLDAVAGPVVW